MELDTIPQPELEQLERVGAADVVIGILDGDTPGLEDTAEARIREALAKFSNPLRAVVVSNNGIHASAPAEPAETTSSPVVFACSLPAPVPGETPQQGISNAYRKIFAVGGKLGARACGLAASTPLRSSPQWIYRLIQPRVLESWIRSGRAVLYAPKDGGPAQPKRPCPVASGALW